MFCSFKRLTVPNHRFRDRLKTKLWQLLELRKKSVEPALDRRLILKDEPLEPVAEWSATERSNSSAFLKTIQAVIDTDQGTLGSKYLGGFLQTTRSPSNLMLLDINELWQEDVSHVQNEPHASDTSFKKTEKFFFQIVEARVNSSQDQPFRKCK